MTRAQSRRRTRRTTEPAPTAAALRWQLAAFCLVLPAMLLLIPATTELDMVYVLSPGWPVLFLEENCPQCGKTPLVDMLTDESGEDEWEEALDHQYLHWLASKSLRAQGHHEVLLMVSVLSLGVGVTYCAYLVNTLPPTPPHRYRRGWRRAPDADPDI